MKPIIYIGVFVAGFVSAFSTLWFHEPAQSTTYGCRPPQDQGERLVVTVIDKNGVLTEQCVYYPVTQKKVSKDLKDWRKYL